MSGAGAAGVAIAKLLLREGVGDIIAADRTGILGPDRDGLDVSKRWMAEHTNTDGRTGSLRDAIRGADVFIGVSGPNVLDPSDLTTMAADPIVFALANPDPEVDPIAAREHAAVVATGRSDYPNQINNVLAFPGIFRGALDARATAITEDMKVAAARALADVISPDELRDTYIVPSPFNEHVADVVAEAVREQARREHVRPHP
jgi:malate dehydrogenase (oxaloacetate-decarboxylating)